MGKKPQEKPPHGDEHGHGHDDGLVGMAFEVFGEAGVVDRRGVIRSDLGAGHYLVEYTEANDGRDAFTVVPIGRLCEPSGDRHGAGAWRLYKRDA